MASKAKARAMRVAANPTAMMGVLLLLVVSLSIRGTNGASSCNTAQTASQLLPCLPAVMSNPEPPSRECCVLIENTSADCLCSCLQSPFAQGIDLVTALQLPRKCNRVVPPGAKCGTYDIPGSSDERE